MAQKQVFVSIDLDELEHFLRGILRDELKGFLGEKSKKSRLLTLVETCDLLRISRSTLNSWIKKGILTPIRLSRRIYFREDQLLLDLERARDSGQIKL